MTTSLWTVSAREDMLGNLFKQVAMTVDTYVSLYHPDPDTELSLGRVLLGPDDWDIVTVGADVHATNNLAVTIDDAVAGTASGIILFDAETAGNILIAQEFDGAATLEVTDTTDVVFAINDIKISLNHTN